MKLNIVWIFCLVFFIYIYTLKKCWQCWDKKTQLEIWADPGLSKNTHTILVNSDSSNFKIEIENIQSEENPGTGKITALSVVASLRGIISSLKVGT